MKYCNPDFFTDISGRLGEVIGGVKSPPNVLLKDAFKDEILKGIQNTFKYYEKECNRLNLPLSAATSHKLAEPPSTTTFGQFIDLCKEFRGRLTDEMRLQTFISIERDKESFLSGKDLFGSRVTIAFPSAAINIEEAGKCIAFERWTAAVFHLSRVAEIAMVNIGKRVGYKSDKPAFGDVLNYMETQLKIPKKDTPPEFKGDITFLSAVTVQMQAVNRAWRQSVAHLDTKYTEEEAIRIWTATKGLMEQIADKLAEESVK